ncbi:MAG: hypothetical protein VXV96_16150 [Bdellovibrionota bacterium]|nr:hypothetical protein [Bdellovibrionota bacterium]
MNWKINKVILLLLFLFIPLKVRGEILVNPEEYEADVEVIFKGKNSVRPQWSHFVKLEEKEGLKLFLAMELPSNYQLREAQDLKIIRVGRHSLLPLKDGRANYPFSIMGNEKILSHGNILIRIKPKAKKVFVESDCKVAERQSQWSVWTLKSCTYKPPGRIAKKKIEIKEPSFFKNTYIGGSLTRYLSRETTSANVIVGRALYSKNGVDLSVEGDLSLVSVSGGDKINDLSLIGSYSKNSPLSLFGKLNSRIESGSLSGRFIVIPQFGVEYQRKQMAFNLGLAPVTSESDFMLFETRLTLYENGILPFLCFERVSRDEGSSYSRLRFGGVVKI